MSFSKPSDLPVWATDPDALIEAPTTEKQEQGWTTNTNTPEGIGEKPPLQYFNWQQNLNYLWIGWINQVLGSVTALGTMASQNANAVAILGGNINNTTIGNTTAAPGTFTTASDSGAAPTTAAQLTNKAYVDGELDTGTFNGSDSIYAKLPGGLILQAFNGTYSGAPEVSSFPFAFPTKCIKVMVCDTAGPRVIGASVNETNPATQFDVFTDSETVDANVWAIGY